MMLPPLVVFHSHNVPAPTSMVLWLIQGGTWWASINRRARGKYNTSCPNRHCLSLFFQKLQLHIQFGSSSGGLLGGMDWLAKGWTLACLEMDGLVSRSHWHSAVQGIASSSVFNLLVRLQAKTHRELHYKPFFGRTHMWYIEAGST